MRTLSITHILQSSPAHTIFYLSGARGTKQLEVEITHKTQSAPTRLTSSSMRCKSVLTSSPSSLLLITIGIKPVMNMCMFFVDFTHAFSIPLQDIKIII